LARSKERYSEILVLSGEVGSRVDDLRAVVFIILVKAETAESISVGVFKDIVRDLLFLTMCEICFQIYFAWGKSLVFYGKIV